MLPPEWATYDTRIFLEGEPRPTRADRVRTPRFELVTPDYFTTMDIPVVSGRVFTVHDDSTSPKVIVVSESMARAYWPGQTPLGKRMGGAGNDTTMATVVGVVPDVRVNPNVGPPVAPTYYQPVAQTHSWRTMSLVIRTKDDPATASRRSSWPPSASTA